MSLENKIARYMKQKLTMSLLIIAVISCGFRGRNHFIQEGEGFIGVLKISRTVSLDR